MEKNEVSLHEVLVYQVLAEGKWVTNREIADRTGVAPRTARQHTLKLVKLGIADQAEVFPAHRYRLSDHAGQRNRGYADRIKRAAEIFGDAKLGKR
jgi:predicted ArsR family transcriptional regulator